ncbi:MAG: ABC transporter substrate-binding protein [Deltaproteobacteria bacterium]|nr:ABC transporter substrate-binding protein [Deltaproteobacteria bacterium]
MKKRNINKLLENFISVILCSMTMISSCAGAEIADETPEQNCDKEKASKDLETAKAVLQQGGNATALLKTIVTQCPGTTQGTKALAALSGLLMKQGECDKAVSIIESKFDKDAEGPAASKTRRILALCRLELGKKDMAAKELEQEVDQAEDEEHKIKIAADIANDLWRTGHYPEAVKYYASFYQGATEAEKNFIKQRVINALDSKIPIADLKQLYDSLKESGGFPTGYLAYKLAKVFYHTRQYTACQKLLAGIVAAFPDHPLIKQTKQFLERMRERFKVDPRALGVILPLSGKYKIFGEKVLHAMEMAAEPLKKKGMALIIRDSAGNADQAAKMVHDLVFNEHVIAIVGPLLSATARAAALKAEELSVPLIAISQAEGLPELGTYIFRHFLTDKILAKALADYAVKELGYKKFGILYPNHPYGKGLMNAFWDELKTLGGEVTACESYPYDTTTFTDEVKKLVGRYYVDARPEYWRFRNDNRKKYKSPTRWRHALEKFLQNGLTPVVDFDALFIPDYYKTVSLIGPALAFEDIEVDQDNDYLKRKLMDKYKNILHRPLKLVRLLGANGWNNQKLIERCDKYCFGAIFVDAWNPASDDPKVQAFIADYSKSFNETPGPIEAFGFDTLKLVRSVIETTKPDSREALRNALVMMKPFDGLTGKTRFNSDGEAEKSLFYFKVTKDGFETINEVEGGDTKEKASGGGT